MLIRLLLALTCTGILTAHAGSSRAVRLHAADDLAIAAVYYPVELSNAPAVILIHALGKNRGEWAEIAPVLQRNGIACLALDLRGHGDSTRRLTADGPKLEDHHNFTAKDFQAMLWDLNAGYEWLLEQPGLDKHRIGLVGASLGANLALRYAAVNEEIAAVLVFSPTLNTQDLRTDTIITKLGTRPLHIAVASEDRQAFPSAKRLLQLRKEAGQAASNELTVCTGKLQGTEILTGTKGMSTVVFGWLYQALRGLPTP